MTKSEADKLARVYRSMAEAKISRWPDEKLARELAFADDNGGDAAAVAWVERLHAERDKRDLLAVLKGLVAWDDANATLDPGDDVPYAELADLLNAARAAIAEAEGR